MSGDRDPAFEEWVQRARDADILSVARDNGAALRKRGRDFAGPCPACNGEDGFVITPNHKDPQKRFLCRKAGKGGDVISMVEHIVGCSFVAAVELINGEPPPKGESRKIDRDVVRERREERKDQQRKADAEEKRERAEKIETAADVWRIGKDIFGSRAEEYLIGRGLNITEEQAVDLRFVPSLDYFGFEDVNAEKQVRLGAFPCMIAAVRNVAGELIAVHRTYLDPSDATKLRPPGDRSRNKAKKIVGRPQGGMIRLGYLSETLAMGEGIETTLSWYRLGYGGEDVSLAASYSVGNLSGSALGQLPHPINPKGSIPNGEPDPERPGVILPPEVKEVILIGDGDSDRPWTLAHLLTAGRRFRSEGRTVTWCIAPADKDFNDLLMEMKKGEA